jgi:hypothetical protein
MVYLLVGACSLIALVFGVSAGSKLRSRRAFSEFVAATGRLSPRPLTAPNSRRLAIAVVAAEVVVVPLVLIPATAPVGLVAGSTLLIAFTGAILLAVRRGERAPCRCFGSATQPLGYAQVIRNLVLLGTALAGLVGALLTTTRPDPAGLLIAVAAGALGALLVVMADDIAALFRSP